VAGPDIFISYSREERPKARQFAESFAAEGFNVWWDAALRSGQTFDEVIESNLRAAKAVVVLWSPRSVASRWVRAEATLADRSNKLVPVIIEACTLPIIFELTQAADLADWSGDASDHRWRTLIGDLQRLVGGEDEIAPALVEAAEQALSKGVAQVAEKPSAAEPDEVIAALERLSKAVPPELASPTDAEREQAEFFNRSDEFRNGEGELVHCLLKLDGEEEETRFVVSPAGLTIGRTAPSDIIVPGSGVSRAHCNVELAADQLRVTDLNSTNGTYVDNKRVDRTAMLPVGSVLRVGTVSFEHEVRTREKVQPRIDVASFGAAAADPLEARVARR
jgi:hypothetical protein